MKSVRSAVNLTRDGLLLIVLPLLMVFPTTFNKILTEAGFKSASIWIHCEAIRASSN